LREPKRSTHRDLQSAKEKRGFAPRQQHDTYANGQVGAIALWRDVAVEAHDHVETAVVRRVLERETASERQRLVCDVT
jgi:hypothetical protein